LFLSLKILFIEMGLAQNSTAYDGVNVRVVLDLECFDVNIALSCIKMALSDF
jgi:ionotropic glutamate receptor